MKTISKLFILSAVVFTALVFVMLFADSISATQNPNYPSPSRCKGADWNIGLPNGTICSSSVTTDLFGDAGVNIFGTKSRLRPDLTSLNKYCQQYTGDKTSYATYGSVHNYCTSCDQNLSYWNGSSWVTNAVCAGTLNVQWVKCSTSCKPTCLTHSTKQCVGNSVYWFNSCSVKEDLFQACTSNQVCQNAQCVDIACSTNSQCGTNGYTGSPFCQGGDVYQNYKTYTCNNPGTASSACSNSTAPQLKSNCTGNQICSDGQCINQTIACSTNSQCGTNEHTGGPFCMGNSVYQNYKTYTCNNPGTANSNCSQLTAPQLITNCTANQICSLGSCTNPNITCSTNAQCGKDSLTGNPFCQGNNVFTNQLTYFCNNPGTSQSFCSNSLVPQLTRACGTNKTCTNGDCASQNIACGSNSDCGSNGLTGNAFCQGDSAYKNYITYSCNNPGTSQSFCSNSLTPQLTQTCSPTQNCVNGSCTNSQTITCSTNTQCGTNAYTGSPFCQGGDVYQNYRTYVCNNPGTASSACSDSTAPQLKSNCTSGQTCSSGQCQNVNIACSTNSECGASGVVGSPFCANGDVYRSYRTYTCNNAGTANSSCTNSTVDQLVTDCTANQTCSNGSCSGTNCTYHSYQQCSGNYLYWYDSCGVQQDSQYCSSGCTNNSCNNQQNYLTVQTNSATNIYNNQATLNGYLSGINTNNTNYVWFQWGTTTSYGSNGYETSHQTMNYTGSFSQNITGISPGVVYHFRAVAQGYNGQIVYGQDMTFQVGQVLGVTDVNTGFTNNFLVDSFFLPLMIALAGIWLFKSGILNTGAWIDGKKMKRKDYIANKELMAKISQIKERENR